MRVTKRILAIITIATIASGAYASAIRPSEDDVVTADKPHDFNGLQCSISLNKQAYTDGDPILVTITLKCIRNPRKIFNPFFNGLLELPGRLRVYDESGRFVCQFLDFEMGSRASAGSDDFAFLRDANFVGTTVRIDPAHPTPFQERVPPGRYKIQLVLFDTIIFGETRPASEGREPKLVAASELMPFEIVPKE